MTLWQLSRPLRENAASVTSQWRERDTTPSLYGQQVGVVINTGHEDYDTMKPYIALTDKIRKKCMEDTFGF